MENEERNNLIKLRLEQADKTYDDAAHLIADSRYEAALNRIYYGMFYTVLALALKYGFKTSKHTQLLGWFNREFIKPGLIDVKFNKIVKDAFEKQNEADYEITPLPPAATIEQMLSDMRLFIDEIKNFITNHN
jgi:uncharacterized protein (UPF0332 family)